MKSIYHILDKPPAIHPDDMQIEYAQLAKELVASGRLRIDTDYYCNFVKYYDTINDINIILSLEELNNPKLFNLTTKSIKELYIVKRRSITAKQIKVIITSLRKKAKKLLSVNIQLKMQLASMFVQSAHPIAIRWLLLDRVQVFITYSHSIGDVMNIVDWKRSGENSGMQSTDGTNACIYVSCGGDPFALNNSKDPTIGDGWAAAARLQIIAGQEIGHYADIKRDANGNQITRHSANFICTKAVPHVKLARINDITRCNKLQKILRASNVDELINSEKKLRFYDQQNITGIRVWVLQLTIFYYRRKILKFAEQNKMHFVKRFERDRYMGMMIMAMIEDMKSHLSPVADVYKRSDPQATEAIACVEALARVPQQVMKWGYLTTRATMHDLYHVYYKEVIPSLIESYNGYTGEVYRRRITYPKQHFITKFTVKILRRFGILKKNGFRFTEVRTPD